MQKDFLQHLITLILLVGSAVSFASDDEELARSVLEKSDQIRFPGESFQVDVTINSISLDRPVDVHKYQVLSKNNENSIVMTTEPASERGQILLMKGRDLWVFMPSISQP
ncbi:MAG TPA: outer membrane lipoprotein-sorting protein, partial [Nitrosospira sp.]